MSKEKSENLRKKYNAQRSAKISMLSRKNYEMSKQLRTYIDANKNLTDLQIEFLYKLDKSISSCAAYSLYRVLDISNDKDITYIGSHKCKHRNCNICNWYRQKEIKII